MRAKKPRKLKSEETLPNPFPRMEEEILDFWNKAGVFKKTLEQTKAGKPFVFFEGPPTANGQPGIHHVLARIYKDAIVRFKTMQGFFVERKAGWDTHGLPVELQVEKALKISGKQEIESLISGDKKASIIKFNSECKSSVMRYRQDWEQITSRIGFWLDLENPYITYTPEYIESVWWIIKQISQNVDSQGQPLLFQGHKVVQHCPRCETALSSHEVAQGYKTVTETSVYLKFKIEKASLEGSSALKKFIKTDEPVYVLSWTTTPWTLPGNVALAIGEDINYAVVKKADEYYILAKDRLSILEDYKVLGEISGKALIGLSYEPLFAGAVNRGNSQTAWTVLPAGFVTTADGTGVVHTAVMYGEEDYQLGKTAGLPTQHTVDQTGRFLPSVKKWAGQFVKAKDVEAGIIQDLQDRGLLLKLENYTHEYPFCWRCETPLLYYAKDSWFIRMSSLRSELLANNQNINWVPAYLKTGRFGEWLKEVKDWAISRERYWGTPLPIWVCEKCKAVKVVGSFKDLQEARGSKAEKRSAQILIMRHGVSTKNFPSIVQSRIEDNHKHILTKEGKKNVKETAEKLKGEIDIIISSDFQRTRETAEIVSQITGAKIVYDRDLREIYEPDYEGRPVKEVQAELESQLKTKYPPLDLNLGGGENYYQVKTRMQRAVQNAIRNFTNKRILIVSHGDPLWILKWSYSGLPEENYFETPYPKKGEFEELTVPIQFDPHRPFVDEIKLTCEKCSGEMRRVPEVLDVWFDSGAMPFAQWHYPFENADRIDKHKNFPADYISEGIDQTRGWFYTLLAISTLLGKGAPFKNVISLGLILDKSGQKMSKSKGNVVEPKAVIDEFGADALRLHLFAMSQPGEPKLFDLKGVEETVKKTILIFWNIFTFYQTYVAEAKPAARDLQPENLMDKWILARLAQATQSVTAKMEAFDPTSAVRELQNFITELSTWYLRRSREKLRPGENFDPITASVLKSVLQKTCVLLAPFAPFLAEKIYQEIKETSAEMSVHLAAWPTDFSFNEKSLSEMAVVRRAVEKGHALRRLLDIKVRQPLLMALVSTKLSLEYEKIIAEELNVETVRSGEQEIAKAGADVQWSEETDNTGLKVGLTKEITEELRHKGLVREMARQVNDLRKAAGLTIKDLVEIEWQTADETLNHVFTEHAPVLRDLTRCRSIKKGRVEEVDFKKDLIIGKARVLIGVKR